MRRRYSHFIVRDTVADQSAESDNGILHGFERARSIKGDVVDIHSGLDEHVHYHRGIHEVNKHEPHFGRSEPAPGGDATDSDDIA